MAALSAKGRPCRHCARRGWRAGQCAYDAIMYPTAHRLLAKCDGVLRLAGDSAGAAQDVRLARDTGMAVWYDVDAIPQAG